MPTITLTSGIQFDCEANVSLLEAAAKVSITMAYSCRTGRCSTCKCRVLGGESQALHPESGLTEQEKAAGWILGCVRSPLTDMSLEIDDLGGVVLPAVKTLPCRIHVLEELSPDVVRVVLRLPRSGEFVSRPGQYIDIIGHGGIRRSYSLANASSAERVLELHVRKVSGGAMSQYWFGVAKAGDLLRLSGPLGTFFLRDVTGLDLVFLATGTGIAPVKAILEGMSITPKTQKPRSISVYWGGRTDQDLYCSPIPNGEVCRYVPVLSRAATGWAGARGHVQHALLADAPVLAESVVYACGSDAMIHSAKSALVRAGLPERRFLSDAFVSSGNS